MRDMAKEQDIDVEILISFVEEKPEIWDNSSDDYKDRNKTRDAWRNVCCQLKPDFETLSDEERKEFGQLVLKRWHNIRDQWIKWKKKKKNFKRSGTNASNIRKYIYHEQLKFLEKILLTNSNMGNLANDELTDTEKQQQAKCNQSASNPTTASLDKSKQTISPVKASSIKKSEISSEQQSTVQSSIKKRKRGLDEFELKMLKAIEKGEPEDRHMMFFQSILPSLKMFSECQTVDLQMGVLQLVRNIQKGLPRLTGQSQTQPFYVPSNTSTSNSYP